MDTKPYQLGDAGGQRGVSLACRAPDVRALFTALAVNVMG